MKPPTWVHLAFRKVPSKMLCLKINISNAHNDGYIKRSTPFPLSFHKPHTGQWFLAASSQNVDRQSIPKPRKHRTISRPHTQRIVESRLSGTYGLYIPAQGPMPLCRGDHWFMSRSNASGCVGPEEVPRQSGPVAAIRLHRARQVRG